MKINFRIEVYGLTSRRIMYYLQAFKILALGYWRSEQKMEGLWYFSCCFNFKFSQCIFDGIGK